MKCAQECLLSLAGAAVLAVAATSCLKVPQAGDPIDGLTDNERKSFLKGREEFERVFTGKTGLGPLFNANSCGECHESPVPGGAGDEVEVHVGTFDPALPLCDSLVEKGGPVIQQAGTARLKEALGLEREPEPPEATARGLRTTPDILGFGLLDAVPDSAILALADPDDRNGDGISGRVNRFLDGRIGRFGRKAFVPTLREFNDGAFVIEQGITNPAVPNEESIGGLPIPEGVDPVPEPEINLRALELTDSFVRFLAPPPPAEDDEKVESGRRLFSKIGCESCHLPVLRTGDHPVKALRSLKIAAYTDLLLHDMGPDLADICMGLATPSEFRTEPLMGLRFSEQIEEGEPRFLHDGRARTIEEAIRLHGGEAGASRDRFARLSEEERETLLKFLRSL